MPIVTTVETDGDYVESGTVEFFVKVHQRDAMQESLDVVERNWISIAPVRQADTERQVGGEYRRSIMQVVDDEGDVINGSVNTFVNYARYVEYGTKPQVPRVTASGRQKKFIAFPHRLNYLGRPAMVNKNGYVLARRTKGQRAQRISERALIMSLPSVLRIFREEIHRVSGDVHLATEGKGIIQMGRLTGVRGPAGRIVGGIRPGKGPGIRISGIP